MITFGIGSYNVRFEMRVNLSSLRPYEVRKQGINNTIKEIRKAEVVILKKNKIWKLPDNIRSTVYISFVKEKIFFEYFI